MSVEYTLPDAYEMWDEAVRRVLLCEESDKPLVILLGTGSYSPPHTEHADLMKKCIQKLKEEGKHVICGLLSPSHETYVSGKLGIKVAIRGTVRYELLKNTISDVIPSDQQSEVLACPWELSQKSFVDHPKTIEKLRKYLLARTPGRKVEVWYVCGSDLYANCCSYGGHQADGMIIVLREGARVTCESKNHILIDAVKPKSSTAIRCAGTDHVALSSLMSPTAVDTYLHYLDPKKYPLPVRKPDLFSNINAITFTAAVACLMIWKPKYLTSMWRRVCLQ